MPQVGEDRLHRRHSRCVEFSSALAVDCDFHALGEFERRALVLLEEGHLSRLGPLRMAQAFIPEVARHAVAFRAVELVVLAAVRGAVAPVGVERLAGRTDAGVRLRVVAEVRRLEVSRRCLCSDRLVPKRVGYKTPKAGPSTSSLRLSPCFLNCVNRDRHLYLHSI